MSKAWIRKCRGSIEISILAGVVFVACALLFAQFIRTVGADRNDQSQANDMAIIQMAVRSYAVANKAAFQQNKTLMYVNDQYAPTLAELTNLGYLSATAGANTVNPYGSTFAIKLIKKANNAIEGLVYLNSSVLGRDGQPDQLRACRIARALQDSGVCTSPFDSAVLQNGMAQVPNPSNQPAVVGALVYVAP